MESFKGNTSQNVSSNVFDRDVEIRYFMITNTGATVAIVSVFIKDGASIVRISPKDLHLAVGEGFRGFGLVLKNLEEVVLEVSSGNVDYYFSFF